MFDRIKSFFGLGPTVFTLPPTEPDRDPVDPVKESTAYNAIWAEITERYGPLKEGWREVEGSGGYIYRQYADGRLSIEEVGKPDVPVPFDWTKFVLISTPLVLVSAVTAYIVWSAPKSVPQVATSNRSKKKKAKNSRAKAKKKVT